jgi:hypothetical protein
MTTFDLARELRRINERLDRIDKTLDMLVRLKTGQNRHELTLEDGTGRIIAAASQEGEKDAEDSHDV